MDLIRKFDYCSEFGREEEEKFNYEDYLNEEDEEEGREKEEEPVADIEKYIKESLAKNNKDYCESEEDDIEKAILESLEENKDKPLDSLGFSCSEIDNKQCVGDDFFSSLDFSCSYHDNESEDQRKKIYFLSLILILIFK